MIGVAQQARREDAGAGQNRSMFMDVYAMRRPLAHGALRHDERAVRRGGGQELLPRQHEPARAVPAKRCRSSDVLAERVIVEPLTRAMCSPIGDGAAAAVVVSERKARELGIAQARARALRA